MDQEDYSEEQTVTLLAIVAEASVPELMCISGRLAFPRPTIDELEDIRLDRNETPLRRRRVVEAFQARLVQNRVSDDRIAEHQRSQDAKLKELLSRS